MRRALISIPAALAALLLTPGASLAAGGTSIATAPTISYGALEAGGGVEDEFWRMPVSAGDIVTFDIEEGTGGGIDFRLLSPSINDYTVHQHNEDGLDPTGGKSQETWRSPFTGIGTLWVVNWRDGSGNLENFTFIATLTHATSLAISAPSLARRGSTITVHARVSSPAGTPEGACLISGEEATLSAGVCSKRVRLRNGTKQTIHVSFVPNDGWQAASSNRTIHLLR